MEIRAVRPDEYDRLGKITVEAYTALEGHIAESDYEVELRDVAARAEAPATAVLVATDGDGRMLGGVTYVSDTTSPFAEFDAEDAAGIRMLAVEPAVQRRGVGRALTRACLDRARAEGRAQVILHSTPWMTGAHALYGGLGFERAPELDWTPVEGVNLMGFRLSVPATG
jgi:predicted N-acetyltransferase YhbS